MTYVPVKLDRDILNAIRKHPLTSADDKDDENRLIGWLICAWDVIVQESIRRQQSDASPKTGSKS
jgi:hypothetical protein